MSFDITRVVAVVSTIGPGGQVVLVIRAEDESTGMYPAGSWMLEISLLLSRHVALSGVVFFF